MIKANDVFKVYESYNYVTKDKNGDVYVWKNKPVIDEKYKQWIERLNYTKANYRYLGDEYKIKEFKSKSWKECLIEREKPLQTYDDFVSWLKTKGKVNKQYGFFENYKKDIAFVFCPVDPDLKVNNIHLFLLNEGNETFFTGSPEKCKRVVGAMVEE